MSSDTLIHHLEIKEGDGDVARSTKIDSHFAGGRTNIEFEISIRCSECGSTSKELLIVVSEHQPHIHQGKHILNSNNGNSDSSSSSMGAAPALKTAGPLLGGVVVAALGLL